MGDDATLIERRLWQAHVQSTYDSATQPWLLFFLSKDRRYWLADAGRGHELRRQGAGGVPVGAGPHLMEMRTSVSTLGPRKLRLLLSLSSCDAPNKLALEKSATPF